MLLFVLAISLWGAPQDQPSFQACLADDPGTVGTTVCYGDDLERKKTEHYAVLARIDRKLEVLPAEGAVRPDEARRALGEAQRLWTAFVDADCTAGQALFGEGNAFALARLACEAEHVEARTVELVTFEDTYLMAGPLP